MDSQDTYLRWAAAQVAAAQAEARLNAKLDDFLQHRGTMPDRREFLEVRFLRNASMELLEQALAAADPLPPPGPHA